MMSGVEREAFALHVMKEIRRWPGVQIRPHVNPLAADDDAADDGVEFRFNGRQFGHIHPDCSLHLSLTKALKQMVIEQGLAQALELSASPGWAAFQAERSEDAARAIWLLRLNYVRLRRQRLSPDAAASSELLREHEQALGHLSPSMSTVLQRTQARAPRPLPPLA
ncbi:MAG: luciferase family protein [bacterium]